MEINFKDDEKCLMKKSLKINKQFKENSIEVLFKDNIKKKASLGKIYFNVVRRIGISNKIRIDKDYKDFNIFKKMNNI